MNAANKGVRDWTAVNVVQSMKLLLDLESKRYHAKKEIARNWMETLTPHGIKLRDEIFPKVDFHYHQINVGEYDDWWKCRVSCGNRHERRCFFVRKAVMGSHIGGCSCGIPSTDGLPSHHMVAVV